MGLSQYRRKRRFKKTPEPKGKRSTAGNVRRFVVQKHDASHLHYDFRLEMSGTLKSWAVPKGPSMDPKDKRLAMMVEDHPLDYRTFEGVIPKGNYGAGTVKIWDEGTYDLLGSKRLRDGELIVDLHGKKLRGEFTLVRMRNAKQPNAWLLIKRHEEEVAKKSTRKKGKMPHRVKPMLATLTDKPFDRDGWIFEIKWDGYRILSEIKDGDVELFSRNFQPYNEKLRDLVPDLASLGHDAVLDGEVVVLDKKGVPRFQLLQDYFKTGKGRLVYQVFDLLYLDGEDLRDRPLCERKETLEKMLPSLSHVKFSGHVERKGTSFFKAAVKKGLEGIMAKNAESTYETGRRSEQWLKIKSTMRQEAVIVGYTEPRKTRSYLGAVILGVYKNGKLTYIGHTGGGSDEVFLKELKRKLVPLEQKTSAFDDSPKTNAPVHWVKPKLICEVKFQEWTDEGIMRQPILLGLREDKKTADVVKEEPKFEFTHADKIFWPKEGITKGDVREHYRNVAKFILPHLKDRPESLHRFPNGIAEEGFYHKDVKGAPPWVTTARIRSESVAKSLTYVICNDEKTLDYLVQLGCIEMNPWNSRTGNLDNPDYLIMDLDPEDVPFSDVVRTARAVKDVLDDLGAKSYCKTSGKRGLHVFVPLGAKYTYEHVRLFGEIVAGLVREKLPDLTSVERKPSKRQKRVYLDYLQNKKGATTAAAYSIRPRPGAPVSTPLRWDEVKAGLDPLDFTIKNIMKRLKKMGDIWKPVLGKGIDLEKCLRRAEKMKNRRAQLDGS